MARAEAGLVPLQCGCTLRTDRTWADRGLPTYPPGPCHVSSSRNDRAADVEASSTTFSRSRNRSMARSSRGRLSVG